MSAMLLLLHSLDNHPHRQTLRLESFTLNCRIGKLASAQVDTARMDTLAYRTARLTADAHIQLRVLHAETWPNTTLVVGKVARIYRDKTGGLKRGKIISFDQPFTSRVAPDAGPTRETWAQAKAAEAHLLAFEGDWRVTCDQLGYMLRTGSQVARKTLVSPSRSSDS